MTQDFLSKKSQIDAETIKEWWKRIIKYMYLLKKGNLWPKLKDASQISEAVETMHN